MRFLAPGWLVPLDSGLWAVDRYQPVAAVLDLRDGTVRNVVSWSAQPPPAAVRYSSTVVLDDGTSLWVQQESGGPVVRVGEEGIAASGLVDDSDDPTAKQSLQVCRPGFAWCSGSADEYEVVPRGAPPSEPPRHGRLQRVDSDGRVHTVELDRGVRELLDTPQGLLVAAVGDDVHRRPRWDGDRDKVAHGTRHFLLPWQETPPPFLGDRYALPADFHPPPRTPHPTLPSQDVAGYGPVAAGGGLEWFAGPGRRAPDDDPAFARPVLSARGPDGTTVASWDLGGGWIDAVTAHGTRLTVALAHRPTGWRSHVVHHPVEVFTLDAADGSRTDVLAADAVDVSEGCWPLQPPPVDARSYAWEVLRSAQRGAGQLERVGAREVRYRLDGSWPQTVLELTCTVSGRPGVVLRQRTPLFDELGRAIGSQYAAAHLVDRLASHWQPRPGVADGFLDL
ncbi:hypothetical protein [Kineococcus rhizosphaerae]|uniref:Uncharacterized protein n=1 Tax=Kineococcus rhizosphaerae TaxID=559628 RepID=A0A2T0QZV5_9ACTN|nr:hypothetical protein [Kineococcus rhizosphaerae]PRY12217.1 hypothetical protein CLV37_111174 [Kineococcus rhizosphaerae]